MAILTGIMAGAGLAKTLFGAIKARNVKIPQYEVPQSAYQAVDATRANLGDQSLMTQGALAIKQQQAQALYNQQRIGGSATDAMILASQMQGKGNAALTDLAVKNTMKNLQATQAYTQALNNLTQQEENRFKYSYQTAMEEAKATSGMIGSGMTDVMNAMQGQMAIDMFKEDKPPQLTTAADNSIAQGVAGPNDRLGVSGFVKMFLKKKGVRF